MIRLLGKIPQKTSIAVSGGLDSMAALSFLTNNTNRELKVLYFNHGTSHGLEAEEFLNDYCNKKDIKIIIGKISREKNRSESPEEYWRNCRYEFFKHNSCGFPIITCHHLDDQIETWIFTSLHGTSRLIPYKRGTIIRPFLITKKQQLIDWSEKYDIPYIEDPSNKNTKYMRNHIRHNIVQNCLGVNPGLYKTLHKKILNNYKDIIT